MQETKEIEFSPVSLKDGFSPHSPGQEGEMVELRMREAEAQAKQRWLEERVAMQDAELRRLRTALASAGRAMEIVYSPNGKTPEAEPCEAPHRTHVAHVATHGAHEAHASEPATAPLSGAECAALLRHTVSACGEELLIAAERNARQAAEAVGSSVAQMELERASRVAAADAVWARIIQQQAARLAQLETENHALRIQAEITKRRGQSTEQGGISHPESIQTT